MSLATQPKLNERAPKPMGRGGGPLLDRGASSGFRDSTRGRGRGAFNDRGRGRGGKRPIPGAPPSVQPALTENLSKQQPPSSSLKPDFVNNSHNSSSQKASPESSQSPSSKPGRARSRSPNPTQTKASEPAPNGAKSSNGYSHPRSSRGKRLKKKESTNLKPLSLEDAFASLKCNPFDGEPLKTPLILTPMPQAHPVTKPVHPNSTESGKVDEHEQTLTVPTLGPMSTSRPVTPITPSVHFDWAEDDDGDSLPDLDDWVTSSSTVIPSPEVIVDTKEPCTIKPLPLPIEPEVESRDSVDKKVEEEERPSVISVSPDVEPRVDQGIQEVDHPVTSAQLSEELSVPVVKLPVTVDVAHRVDNKLENVENATKENINLEGPDVKLTEDSSWQTRGSYTRPKSMVSPPAHSNRGSYAAQFDRLHSRALSLPQVNRGSPNLRTRPVISAAGLTRISRTLAQAGVNPTSKAT